MDTFKTKNIILTGATSGIGKCFLVSLLKAGANVSFCGRSEQKMNALIDEIKPYTKGKIHYAVFDLADTEKLYMFIENSYKALKTIDILINCAGLNSAKGEVVDVQLSDLDYMMAINFRSPFILMQEVGKRMKELKQGTVVNILSSACLFTNEKMASYTASKVAMNAASKTFNKEMREHNIRTVSVYPGGVDTEFRANKRPDYLAPQECVDIVLANLDAAKTASLDEIVFRPMVERNFN